MTIIEYPPKSYSKLKRKQLDTVAVALEEQRDKALSQVAKASALIRDLTDPEDCQFDHHGGCQAHGYLSLAPGEMCPQQEAKMWTAETAVHAYAAAGFVACGEQTGGGISVAGGYTGPRLLTTTDHSQVTCAKCKANA